MPSSEAEHVRRLYRSIYKVVRRIPAGRVATYGQVAELAGLPGGARIAIHDPVGAAVQRQLLEDEGVDVGDSGLVALDRYGWLPTTAGSGRAASPRRQPRSGSKRRASSSRR